MKSYVVAIRWALGDLLHGVCDVIGEVIGFTIAAVSLLAVVALIGLGLLVLLRLAGF